MDILFPQRDVVSIIKYPDGYSANPYGFFLDPSSKSDGVRFSDRNVSYQDVEVSMPTLDGALTVSWRGRKILTEIGSAPGTEFNLAQDSDLFGLGQFRDPITNFRGRSVYLAQGNSDAVCPLLVSPDGYGILWDTGTDSQFSNKGPYLSFSNPSPVTRYHVLMGDSLESVIARYRDVTGRAPMLPKYAYGFWQSQERYNTQTELTDVLDGYRARSLPLDVMVQDWGYWGEDAQFSGMVWDKTRFPDPAAMSAHVHANNAHLIASVWPAMGPGSSVYMALDQQKLLFKNPHWSGSKVLDVTAPKAQAIYWNYIRDGLLSAGLDGLWTDGSEPEFMSTGNRYVTTQSYISNGDSFAGPLRDNALTFSYYQTRLLYNGMKALHPAKRPFVLTRSVYAGQQAFNAITWSGDIFAGWETLRNQVTAVQQISLSGIPYWTDDIGGFLVTHRFPEGLKSAAYRELYVRWFQFGAFLPVFRAHGTEIRRELWAMGEAGEPHFDALKKALEQRYALMPYIYALASRVTHHHETVIRPMVMDFAADRRIHDFPSQYMFGRDLLICPVTTPLEHSQTDPYAFIPNYAVTGTDGPAATVAFYEGANFNTLVETRLSDDLKMSWFGDLPTALKGKPYSARWQGRITAEATGTHKFRIITQGLIRFVLDGKEKVASAGSTVAERNMATGAVSFAGHRGNDVYLFEAELVAGKSYAFELTQSQPKPDAVSLWVEWITPQHAREMVASPDKTISIYLPQGTHWYTLGQTTRQAGGQVVDLRPALDEMPVFVRAGAIIPMTPGLQYANALPIQTELHIYPGRDGLCTLYDDAGDGYGYAHGEYAETSVVWDDARSILTIGPCRGHYTGQPGHRCFMAVLYHGDGTVSETITLPQNRTAKIKF